MLTDHLPSRARQRPGTPVLDRTHPLAQGLLAYVVPGVGELVKPGGVQTLVGAAGWTSTPIGRAVNITSATADGYSAPLPGGTYAKLSGKTTLTVACWAQISTTPAINGHLMAIPWDTTWAASPFMFIDFVSDNPDSTVAFLRWNIGTGNFQGSTGGGGSGTGYVLSDGRMHCYVAVRDATTIRYYRDGVLYGTQTGQDGTAFGPPTTQQPFNLGTRATSSVNECQPGAHAQGMLWNRVLNATEIRELSDSPESLLIPAGRFRLPMLQALGTGVATGAVALTATETLTVAATASTTGAVALTATETLTVAAVPARVGAVALTALETLAIGAASLFFGGGFESGSQPYTGSVLGYNGTVGFYDAAVKRTGSLSLRVDYGPATAGGGGPQGEIFLPMDPGGTLRTVPDGTEIRADLWVGMVVGYTYTVSGRAVNAAGALLAEGLSPVTVASNGGFQLVTLRYRYSSGSGFVPGVQVVVPTQPAAVSMWTDDVTIVRDGPIVTQPAAVALTAAETLAVAAVVGPVGAVALTATETLTVAAVPSRVGAVSLTATLTTSVAASVTIPAAAVTLTAAETLGVTAVRVVNAAVALSALATLSVAGTISRIGAVALTATETLTVTAQNTIPGAAATLTAVETLTVSGFATTFAAVALTAVETLTASAIRTQYGAVALSAHHTLAISDIILATVDVRAAVYELHAFAGDGTDLGILPDYSTLTLSLDLSDVGAVRMDYPDAGIRSALLDNDAELGVFVDGVEIPDCRWIVENVTGDDAEAQPVRTYAGRNLWKLFDDVIVYPGAWPLTADLTHTFSSATAGVILGTLFTRAQARGLLPGVAWAFTNTLDSNGNPWTLNLSVAYDLGVSYLAVIQNLVDQGVIDVRMVGRECRVTNPGGVSVDRTVGDEADIVRLQLGRDIQTAPVTTDSRGLRTVALVKGDDGVVVELVDPLATAPGGPGRRETFISQGGISDPGTLAALAQTTLDRNKQPREQIGHTLALPAGGLLPLLDYFPGDYVLSAVSGGDGLARLRVRQLTVTINPASMTDGSIVLNDKFLELDVALARKVAGITGGATAGGGSGAVPVDDAPDLLAPAAPSGIGISSSAYLDPSTSIIAAQATITWSPVTTNSDGTAITDLDGYEVEYQVDPESAFQAPHDIRPGTFDPVWTARFHRLQQPRGWIAGDGGASIRLPDGRDVFLWNDSYIGKVKGDGSIDTASPMVLVHNALTVNDADGGGFVTHCGGTSGAETPFVSPTDPTHVYWPQSGVYVAGGTLALWAQEFSLTPAPWGTFTGKTALVIVNVATMTVTSTTTIFTGESVAWGQAHYEDATYTYVFGLDDATTRTYVYRVPKGTPNGTREYWTGSGWSTTRASATHIIAKNLQAVGFIGGRFVGLFIEPLGQHIKWATASAVTGPWSIEPTDVYDTPEAVIFDQIAYFPRMHFQHGEAGLLMSYSPNALDIGDTFTDVRLYQPQFLRGPADLEPPDTTGSTWGDLPRVGNTQAFVSPLPAGGSLSVRVRAVDHAGNRSSWTTYGAVRLGTDTTAPPKPSAPGVFGDLAGLFVTWDGLGALGEEMPADFWHAQVHISRSDGFTPSADTRVDAYIGRYGGGKSYLRNLTYGETYFVRIVGVDYAGNLSTPSDQTSAVVPQLLGPDIADGIISELKLADGAVTTEKIYPASVTTAHLVVGAFSDNSLPNGDFEDDNLVSAAVPAHWTLGLGTGSGGVMTRDTTAPSSGSACLKIAMTHANEQQVIISDPIPVSAGDLWYFAFKAKASRALATAGLELRLYVGATLPINPFAVGATINALVVPLTTSYPTSAFDVGVTIPAGAKWLIVGLDAGQNTGDTAAVDVFVDEVRARRVVGTAQIADAAIVNAKIANLAVDDAKIAGLSVGKLTAGNITAVTTISGRIATALTGARTEINSAGVKGYNSAGTELTSIDSSSGGIVGRYFKTASGTGRRIELGTFSIAGDPSTILFAGSPSLGGLPPATFLSGVGVSDGSDALAFSSGQRTLTASQSLITLSSVDGIILVAGVNLDNSRIAKNILLDAGPGGQVRVTRQLNLAGTAELQGDFNATTGYAPRFTDRSGSGYCSLAFDGSNGVIQYNGSTVKTFIIDHPLDVDRWLVHSTIEGPEAGVYYRGQGMLDADGWGWVDVPGYAAALCTEDGWTLQLSVIGEAVPIGYRPAGSGAFCINGTPGTEFTWTAFGVRGDVDALDVEPYRSDIVVAGDGPYRYARKASRR